LTLSLAVKQLAETLPQLPLLLLEGLLLQLPLLVVVLRLARLQVSAAHSDLACAIHQLTPQKQSNWARQWVISQ
jgi:hypothetical protein